MNYWIASDPGWWGTDSVNFGLVLPLSERGKQKKSESSAVFVTATNTIPLYCIVYNHPLSATEQVLGYIELKPNRFLKR